MIAWSLGALISDFDNGGTAFPFECLYYMLMQSMYIYMSVIYSYKKAGKKRG